MSWATDLSTFSYPHRTSTSSYRVPTPPRIVVPPPTLNENALPDFSLNVLKDTASLTNNTSYNKLVQSNVILEWNYERRREAQMVLPYLYLGPLAVLKDEAWLRREGITCLLGVRQKGAFQTRLINTAMTKVGDIGISHCAIDVDNNQDLIQSFSSATQLILQHVAQHLQQTGQLGKVLVFCESGNERSAAIVAAYLMETHEDVDHIKAMQLCQAQRFCVNFDDGLKRLLQGYWDILCAKRQVAETQGVASANGGNDGSGHAPVKAKRTLEREEEEDEDEEMVGMDQDDAARFRGRQFAPFVDQPI